MSARDDDDNISPPGARYAQIEDLLDISTYPVGDQASFHTTNDPDNPFQRDSIVQRQGRVNVQCIHRAIVHGFFSDEINQYCSLLVFDFNFTPNGPARRIKQANVSIRFSAMDKQKSDPEVYAMFPKGSLSLDPTMEKQTLVRGGSLKLGGAPGLEAGGKLKMQSTIEREVSSATTVRGSIDIAGRTWGKHNSVSWTMWENQSTKTGVARFMRAPVLLKRSDSSHFKATVKIEVIADTITELKSIVFKADCPQDDDIWYDPNLEPSVASGFATYDADNLGLVNLDAIWDVKMDTIFKEGCK